MAADSTIEEAVTLMRCAVDLLDAADRSAPAEFVQHAIELVEEEMWAVAGIHAAHAGVQ